jgi:hypothetical protein
MVPRPTSPAHTRRRNDEDDFNLLVESIETLLFTSADHPDVLDRVVLRNALAELEARWPEAADLYRPRIEARERRLA